MNSRARAWAASALAAALACPAWALDLSLTSGEWRPSVIVVEDFPGETAAMGEGDEALSSIVRADLSFSGYFRAARGEGGGHGATGPARYASLRSAGGEYLLTGEVRQQDGEMRMFFELHDALTEASLARHDFSFGADSWREAAHTISNEVFKAVTKKPGAFLTKVAYVVRHSDGMNLLQIADYDGHNPHTILYSHRPLISPTWSPDGNDLLYVSFERDRPVVYRQSLLNGERIRVANFPGSNSSPAMSPNGSVIAVSLTDNRHASQIYLISPAGRRKMRNSSAIETEPAWSPDGKRIAFVSDSAGGPQLYEYFVENNLVRRVSYGSSYCVSPSYSSDGVQILHVRRDGRGRNNAAILDLRTKEVVFLSNVREADSPSFSPDDTMILLKDESVKNSLRIVSINGIITNQWKVRETGEIINPVWGPAESDWF